MTDVLTLIVYVSLFVAALAVAGSLEGPINRIMGWTDEHRDARRRNR